MGKAGGKRLYQMLKVSTIIVNTRTVNFIFYSYCADTIHSCGQTQRVKQVKIAYFAAFLSTKLALE